MSGKIHFVLVLVLWVASLTFAFSAGYLYTISTLCGNLIVSVVSAMVGLTALFFCFDLGVSSSLAEPVPVDDLPTGMVLFRRPFFAVESPDGEIGERTYYFFSPVSNLGAVSKRRLCVYTTSERLPDLACFYRVFCYPNGHKKLIPVRIGD